MQSIDELPINLAIELYYEKHQAMRQGNLERLIAMKQQYPSLFTKEQDHEIRDIILYAKEFQKTPRYEALRRMALEEKLAVIATDDDEN